MVGWSDGEELGLALAGLGGRKRARQYTGQHAGLIGCGMELGLALGFKGDSWVLAPGHLLGLTLHMHATEV